MPGYTNAVVYDTSRMIGNVRWRIRRVLGANTSANEWALLNTTKVAMLVRGARASKAAYYTVRINAADVVTPTPLSDQESHFITTVEADAIMGDASVADAGIVNGQAHVNGLLPGVNAAMYWDGHPTVSRDGTMLVFASDRPGGEGGTDLWHSKKSGNGWTVPRLVEGTVNTPCDELSPQFASDSVLLFASAGHATVGGYDLFSARIEELDSILRVGEPRNLGAPVNTKFDELFPIWHSANTLYYSSDQPSRSDTNRKDFDVFVLTSAQLTTSTVPDEPPPTVSDSLQLPPQPSVTISGTVISQETKKPVSGAEVTATNPDNNNVISQTTSDTVGNYALQVPPGKPVDIQAQTPDLFFDKVRVDVPMSGASVNLPANAEHDTVRVEKPLALPATFVLRVNFPTAIFDKPYENVLDSNGMETGLSWQSELDELAKNVKHSGERLKKLVLIGHTDDVDTDANNLVLGRNRVNFIIDQLVLRGVNKALLEGRSAGESLLPSRRQNESVVLWRKRARRVELIKVLQE